MVGLWLGVDARPGEALCRCVEDVAAIEAPSEAGEVALSMLGADVMIGAGERGLDVAERRIDPGERRPSRRLAAGTVCAVGTLGILIPPSIMLIVYAATSNVSIVKLYAGAIFPGFLLAGLYMVYVVGRAWLNPKLAPKPPEEETEHYSTGQILFMLATSFFPLAFLILAVLGAILFGLATPSEAESSLRILMPGFSFM